MTLRPIHDPIGPDENRDASGAWKRSTLNLASQLFLYGLLVGGAAIFAIPFIWMIGTSLKVDREMFGETITLLPQKPVPALQSPFLDEHYFKTPDSPEAQRVRGVVLDTVQTFRLGDDALASIDEKTAALLFPGIYKKVRDILPSATWKLDDAALADSLRQQIDEEMVREVYRAIYRPLTLGSVRVRSFDLQEQEMTRGHAISDLWSVSSVMPARIQDVVDPAGPAGVLYYDFTGAAEGAGPVKLSTTLALPFQAERLFRILISLTPDDSWHRMDFYYEKNCVKYAAMRPVFLGDNQAMVVTLQEYGPEDESNSGKIRLWYACREVDRGPQYESRPDHVKVTAELTRSSQLDAWWAKAYRNYRGALNYIPFWRYVGTSAFLVILNIIGTLISCSLVAYAFARLQWPGRQFSFALMMATMMIPPQVTMIPYFLIIKELGWYNTLHPLWVISFFGNAFNIFLLRQFMKGIPRDLEDAARIDGCNFLQVYWHVIMPLIKPTLACIAIFTFMGVWNDFMGPLIYLSDQSLYPLSLGLYALNVQEGGNYGMMMAGSFLMTLPVVIIFFFAQKYFIQGVTLTGMKG